MMELFKIVTDGCGSLIALDEGGREIARSEVDQFEVEENEQRAMENALFDLVRDANKALNEN